jgi:hypothetical protein
MPRARPVCVAGCESWALLERLHPKQNPDKHSDRRRLMNENGVPNEVGFNNLRPRISDCNMATGEIIRQGNKRLNRRRILQASTGNIICRSHTVAGLAPSRS